MVTPGSDSAHPRPNGPPPVPVLYTRLSAGSRPFLPGGTRSGTLKFPVPVYRSGVNFSPRPARAPPPLGSEITSDAPVTASSAASSLVLDDLRPTRTVVGRH